MLSSRQLLQFVAPATVALFATAALAYTPTLPAPLKKTFDAAYQTGDQFIISSVKDRAKQEYPELAVLIEDYSAFKDQQSAYAGDQQAQAQPASVSVPVKKPAVVAKAAQLESSQELAAIEPAAGESADAKKEKNWKGSLEAGAAYETGNTETEQFNIAATLDHDFGHWENTLKLRADTSKENQVRNAEEYRVSDQLRYTLTDVDYVFGELDYVNDRFSGYNYRVSELLGYGRKIVNEDDLKISAEGSVGSRQSELQNGNTENSFLTKLGGKVDWTVNDYVSFLEDLSVAIGEDATITTSETALKSKLSDQLYLKLGVLVEHISDVPVGRENTDTKTTLTVGYDF